MTTATHLDLIKRIQYSRDDHDYAAYITIDGLPELYIGSADDHLAAEKLCNDYAFHYYADNHTPEAAAQLAAAFEPAPGDDCPPDCPDECPTHGHGTSPLLRIDDALSRVIFELALTNIPALVAFLRGHTDTERQQLAWRYAAWLKKEHGIVCKPEVVWRGWAALLVGASASGR